MLNDKMVELLNDQVNKEMYSAYLYLLMAQHSNFIQLKGFAKWFTVQYEEELEHALHICKYINDMGAKVKLEPIKQPPTEFDSPLDMFEKTLEHEQFITRSINELFKLSIDTNDYATNIFLHPFITEQIEEEAYDTEIIAKLKVAGEDSRAINMIDKELGERHHLSQ